MLEIPELAKAYVRKMRENTPKRPDSTVSLYKKHFPNGRKSFRESREAIANQEKRDFA